jgi:hypothetical protein
MPQYLSRHSVFNAVTTNPWTKDFRHLLAFPRHWARRVTRHDAPVKSVAPRDRIKWWNIVPGDQIRLLGDKEGVIREVISVNRLSNRVFVKGGGATTDVQNSNKKNFHYSRCQLFIGNYELPPARGEPPKEVPVFAKRLGSSSPVWNKYLHRYDWSRFATTTDPPLKHIDQKITIPWPRHKTPDPPKPGPYETERDSVAQITYTPPAFSFGGPIPRPPTEKEYLKTFVNPTLATSTLGVSSPVEVYLTKELSNPHSRAKKQARWQAHQAYKKALLKQITEVELNDLRGRSVKHAKEEAIFRWRVKLQEDKKADKKRRWKTKEQAEQTDRKAKRKAKKAMRLRRRLTELVLEDEPNQVVPKDA